MEVSSSTYYYWLKNPEGKRELRIKKLLKLFLQQKTQIFILRSTRTRVIQF